MKCVKTSKVFIHLPEKAATASRRLGSPGLRVAHLNATLCLPRAFRGGFLAGASAFEEMYEAVVPLVTGVLENRPIKPADGHFPRPGSRPSGGVFHREFVTDPVCIDAGEALDHMQRVAGQEVLSSVPRSPS